MSKVRCGNEDCDVIIDTDVDDYRYSPLLNGDYCWGCYESYSEGSSTVWHVVGPNDECKWIINDFEIVDGEYGEAPYPGEAEEFTNRLTRVWHPSDGWRGYYQTTIAGWREITGGWTTGNWSDEVSDRKQTFNEWAEGVVSGEIVLPVPVALVADPTSNLFSTAVSLWVADSDYDILKEFLANDLATLKDSLS